MTPTALAARNRRQLLAMLLATMFAVAGIMIYLLWSGYREARRGAETTTSNLAWLLESRLDDTLRRTETIIEALALSLPETAMNRQAAAGHAGKLDAELKTRLLRFQEVAAFRVFDAAGEMLYTSDRAGAAAINIADRDFFARLRDDPGAGTVFSPVITARSTGRRGLAVGRAVRDGQGRFLGAVFGLIELQVYQDFLASLDVGAHGAIAIRRSDNSALILRHPPLEAEINKPVPPDNPAASRVLGGGRTGTLEFAAATDGLVRIFSFRRLERYPFYILVGLARDDVFGGWRQRMHIVGVAGLLLLGALAAMLSRLWRAEGRERRAMVKLVRKAQQLRASEARLGEAMDMARMAYWEYDSDADQFTFDDRFYALYRTTAAANGGYRMAREDYVRRYLHPGDAAQVSRNIARAVERADPAATIEDEARILCGDGLVRWVLVRIFYVPPSKGHGWKLAGTVIDIDERKHQEEYGRRLRDIIEAARDIIASADAEGRLTYLNHAGRELLGIGADEDITGTRIPDYHAPEVGAKIVAEALPRCLSEGYWQGETMFRRRDGSEFPALQTIVAHRLADGRVSQFSTIARDVSSSKRTERQLSLLARVFEHSGEAILITDRDNRIVEVNPAFTQLTGYGLEDVRGRNPRLLSAGRTSPEEYRTMWRAINEEGFWQGEVWDRRKDGDVYPKWLTISTMRDDGGAVTNYIASFTDITEHKVAEERIRHLAHHDALTGLPNRFHLQGRLEQAITTARREGGQLAVMFIDLDRFKIINDTLGHHVGDGILVEVARRLRDSVRESDVVARLGGDEFVVVLTDIETAAVAGVADKILKSLGRVHQIGSAELHSTPSIGISLFPDDGETVETLMKGADAAMYHAKSAGRNNYQFFTAAMNQIATERLMLENSLRQALERGEFELHYQPQIETRSGRAVGVEALLRWRHPEWNMVPPLKFIPIAEDTGLIGPLGEWVLREALRQLAAWRAAGVGGLRVAVNLSAHQLRNGKLPALVAEALAAAGLAPGDLELEITESVAMHNPEATIEVLNELRDMGVELAIDDFGTGYSSLSYLKLLPIHRLKLDRSFVMDIEHDSNDAAICAATIALAHSLGLDVVAEGVETAAQFEYLKELGCDVTQGYFFSRPLPGAEVGAYVLGPAGQGSA